LPRKSWIVYASCYLPPWHSAISPLPHLHLAHHTCFPSPPPTTTAHVLPSVCPSHACHLARTGPLPFHRSHHTACPQLPLPAGLLALPHYLPRIPAIPHPTILPCLVRREAIVISILAFAYTYTHPFPFDTPHPIHLPTHSPTRPIGPHLPTDTHAAIWFFLTATTPWCGCPLPLPCLPHCTLPTPTALPSRVVCYILPHAACRTHLVVAGTVRLLAGLYTTCSYHYRTCLYFPHTHTTHIHSCWVIYTPTPLHLVVVVHTLYTTFAVYFPHFGYDIHTYLTAFTRLFFAHAAHTFPHNILFATPRYFISWLHTFAGWTLPSLPHTHGYSPQHTPRLHYAHLYICCTHTVHTHTVLCAATHFVHAHVCPRTYPHIPLHTQLQFPCLDTTPSAIYTPLLPVVTLHHTFALPLYTLVPHTHLHTHGYYTTVVPAAAFTHTTRTHTFTTVHPTAHIHFTAHAHVPHRATLTRYTHTLPTHGYWLCCGLLPHVYGLLPYLRRLLRATGLVPLRVLVYLR